MVRNSGDPNRGWEGLFPVDTGATDCTAPEQWLRSIGIETRSTRNDELANGSEIKLEIGVATVKFMGEPVGTTMIFGGDDIEPIPGVTTLETKSIQRTSG